MIVGETKHILNVNLFDQFSMLHIFCEKARGRYDEWNGTGTNITIFIRNA